MYFDDPRGTGSVLDISSGCLEAQNKQFRDFVNNRSWRGNTLQQTTDVLKQQYLSGTFLYAQEIEKCSKSTAQRCSNCKKYTIHNRRTCIRQGGIREESTTMEEGSEEEEEDEDEGSTEEENEESENFDDEGQGHIPYNIPAAETEMFNQDMYLKIPNDFFDKFAEVTKENNLKGVDGLESLAYIFGSCNEGVQNVSHLIFMNQIATHSKCEPTELGNIQVADFNKENPTLGLLGWAHTHPR